MICRMYARGLLEGREEIISRPDREVEPIVKAYKAKKAAESNRQQASQSNNNEAGVDGWMRNVGAKVGQWAAGWAGRW